ncbi:isoleucine--tRNA ligase [Nanoarchaeota archaeon]
MIFPLYNPKEIELSILKYWKDNKINEKTREMNKEGKKFYFLDGPPYTSGRLHLAHAWNYALKDMAIRYRKMQGFNVWDRNGFDMHGLPTAHKVMDKHGFKTKEEIIKYGLDKFIKECMKFSKDMADLMTKDIQRLGVSLNLEDPYMPIVKEFMEGEWWFIKQAHEQKRLYYGEKVLTWCQNCETALAKHECEYETVTDDSIFVKFPIRGKEKEFLIIWTTTPWTIPFNLAVMANPNIDYVKAKVEGEVWILAKALAGSVVKAVADKELAVIEEFKGDKLEGLEYIHPFEEDIPKLKEIKEKYENTFTVILNEKYVDTSAGSGLVHAAPGCGPEDQEACKPYKIPPFNSLKEDGFFSEEMGKFSGFRAKVDDKKFVAHLKKKGNLIAITKVEHEYPHCWRCHKPVVFRITYQWFLKIEDIKKKMLKDNDDVHWVPETSNNSFKSWVENLRDNSISRQRFWGTPLPVWKCDKCNEVEVFGSSEELKERSGKVPKDLHMPWIDEITYPCKCGGESKRVPDVIDVWIDAGTASWNCLNNDKELIKEWLPADLILEAKEQTRLWFSMLSICSQIAFGENLYKNVYVYGMLTDIEGKKMSKSLGNIISPYELIDKYGSDVLRYYMCQNNAGEDINFSWDECKIKDRQLRVLWNIHKFLIDLARENETNPFELDEKLMGSIAGLEEKYILSKLNKTIKQVTELSNNYQLDETIGLIEELFLDLSRTYIQIVREKSSIGSKAEKDVCMHTISRVLLETLKIFAPIAPLITDAMYQNLREEFGLSEESIHHYSWPGFSDEEIEEDLEEGMEISRQVIQASLNLREKIGLGVRWPLKEIIVATKNKEKVEDLKKIIEKQVNVKEIKFVEEMPGVKVSIKPDYKTIGPTYGDLSPKIIARLATDSNETILEHIEKEGAYRFDIDDKEVSITKNDLIFERKVQEPYLEGMFREGFVYVNPERTPELDGEGFAREIMRSVQQMRKESGLEKKDRINLFVKVEPDLFKIVEKFKHDIKEKVGAETIEIDFNEPTNILKNHDTKKIKKKEFKIWFDKV